jgi:hypothetical protein
MLRPDADAAICDPEAGVRPGARGADDDRPAASVADRVRQQVADHLVDARDVEVPPDRAGPLEAQGRPAARGLFVEALGDGPDQLDQVGELLGQLHPPGRDTGDVDQRADQRRQAIDLAAGDVQPPRHFFERRDRTRILQQTRQTVDLQRQRGDRRAQLVRGDRQKFVARAHRVAQLVEQSGMAALRILEILVEHEQTREHLLPAGIGLGRDAVVGDRAFAGADLGDVLEHLLDEANVSGEHDGRPPRLRRPICES